MATTEATCEGLYTSLQDSLSDVFVEASKNRLSDVRDRANCHSIHARSYRNSELQLLRLKSISIPTFSRWSVIRLDFY